MHTDHVPIFEPFRAVARTFVIVIGVIILILMLRNFLGVVGDGMPRLRPTRSCAPDQGEIGQRSRYPSWLDTAPDQRRNADMVKRGRPPSNVSKPLPNRVVRGLLRALMTINEPPQHRATRLDVPPSAAGVVRYHSPERMQEIAAHLLRLASAGKIAKLKPATATLLAEALTAYVARPNYDQVLAAVCGSKNCASRPTCFTCRAKVNALLSLFEGTRSAAVGEE